MINPLTLQKDAEELWLKAIQLKDFDDEEGSHELVTSPFVMKCFQMDQNFWQVNFFHDYGELWFRNKFKVRIMYRMEPILPSHIDATPTAEIHDEPIFLAVHAQRTNGRYVYFDREGNPESWK